MIVGILVAVAALAGVVALVWFIARGQTRITALWAVLLVLAVGLTLAILNTASIYYRMPLGWMVILGASALVAIALFVLVGKSVSWRLPKVIAAVALVVAGFALTTIVLIALPAGQLFRPMFDVRGQQIAAEAGFTVLYPHGYELKLDYMPMSPIGDPPEGVNIEYEDFTLQERKAAGEQTLDELRTVLAAGTDPLTFDMVIPSSATYTELEVDGAPALGVEFALNAQGKPASSGDLPGKQSTIRILAFTKGGVDVRIKSEGQMRYQGGSGKNERYNYTAPLSFEDLAKVGSSLAPRT